MTYHEVPVGGSRPTVSGTHLKHTLIMLQEGYEGSSP